MDNITCIILGAGKGSRFSKHPKLLYPLCGKAVLSHVIDLAKGYKTILVTNATIASSEIASQADLVIEQTNPGGTGHAFQLALDQIDKNHAFVLLGDSPLILKSTIEFATSKIAEYDVIFGGFRCSEPNSYGRIQRLNNGYRIVEAKYHPEPTEFYNAGWMCFNKNFIKSLPSISAIADELYLTEYVEKANRSYMVDVCPDEAVGINSMEDYNDAQKIMRKRLLNDAFKNGARIVDPDSVSLNYDTILEPDCEIGPYVVFGPKVVVANNAKVLPFSYIEYADIGSYSSIGPFAYIRGNSSIGSKSTVGAFCEINRSVLGEKVKTKHLSYIGDGKVGNSVNIGAGTVFCNYDGQNKNKIEVMDNAFLGGNCSYVAPVSIGAGSYIGAGTVIRSDVPDETLVVEKSNQIKYKRRYEEN